MLIILFAYAILSLISLAISLYFMKTAPKGWEDENGFHEGLQKH